MTPVERQSSDWNSGAKKFLLIHDGGTFTHVPPVATRLLVGAFGQVGSGGSDPVFDYSFRVVTCNTAFIVFRE